MFARLTQRFRAPPPILRLPNELLLEISAPLSAHDTSSLSLTNQRLRTLLRARLQHLALSEQHCVTALYLAAAHGHEATMRYLLCQGAPLAIAGYGAGALVVSAEARLTSVELERVLAFLMQRGAESVVLSEPRRESALHRAARDGNERLVRVLLAKGVSMKLRDMRGWTPLHWAVHSGNVALLRVLLAHCGVLIG